MSLVVSPLLTSVPLPVPEVMSSVVKVVTICGSPPLHHVQKEKRVVVRQGRRHVQIYQGSDNTWGLSDPCLFPVKSLLRCSGCGKP